MKPYTQHTLLNSPNGGKLLKVDLISENKYKVLWSIPKTKVHGNKLIIIKLIFSFAPNRLSNLFQRGHQNAF